MRNFNASGLRPVIEKKAFEEKVPVLGICVGAQMMTRGSEEGVENGLGWVDADTVRFKLEDKPEYKVPNMGWNELIISAETCPLWMDMHSDPRFYFAHSFHFRFDTPELVTAEADYGYRYPVAFQAGNILATQFHPEKSHKFGMKVLENFAKIGR
jgi:glutamine amidotransferase